MSSKTLIGLGVLATFSIIFVVALSVGYGTNEYLFQDGSKPLTGNWNVGNFNITANYFIGDLIGLGGGNGDCTGVLFQNGTRPLTNNWDVGAFNISIGDSLLVDTINEYTLNAGVTIEGVLLENSDITIPSDNKLYFRNAQTHISSLTENYMDFTVGTAFRFGNLVTMADDLYLISNTSVLYFGEFQDVDLYRQGVGELKTTGKFISGTLESATLDTGQGAYELFAMDQDVETSDEVTFANVTATSHVFGLNIFADADRPINSEGFSFSTIALALGNLSGSGWVYIPSGTWNEAVTVSNDDVIIFGSGHASIIDGGVTGHALAITGDRCTVRDLQVRTTAGGLTTYDGIRGTGTKLTIVNVFVNGSDRYGMFVQGAGGFISNCRIENTDQHGMIPRTNTIVMGTYFYDIGGHGIAFDSACDNSSAIGNFLDTLGNDGIWIHTDCENVIVDGNRITNWNIEAIDDDSGTATIGDNNTT